MRASPRRSAVSRSTRLTSSSSAPTRSCVAGNTSRKGMPTSRAITSSGSRPSTITSYSDASSSPLLRPTPLVAFPCGIGVHQQRSLLRDGERRGQVDGRGGLPDAALLVGNGNDSGHQRKDLYNNELRSELPQVRARRQRGRVNICTSEDPTTVGTLDMTAARHHSGAKPPGIHHIWCGLFHVKRHDKRDPRLRSQSSLNGGSHGARP